jgi:hypothetical protein
MCWRFSKKMTSFSLGISTLSLNKNHSFIFWHYAATLRHLNFSNAIQLSFKTTPRQLG